MNLKKIEKLIRKNKRRRIKKKQPPEQKLQFALTELLNSDLYTVKQIDYNLE